MKPDPGSSLPVTQESEQWQVLAEGGNFFELHRILLQQNPASPATDVLFDHLFEALSVAAQQNPAEFSSRLFESMSVFLAFVMMKVQVAALQSSAGAGPDAVEEFHRTLWPPVQQIQEHLMHLLESWASTSRQWSLASRNRNRDKATNQPRVASSPGHLESNNARDIFQRVMGNLAGPDRTDQTPTPRTQPSEEDNGRAISHTIPATPRRNALVNGGGENNGPG